VEEEIARARILGFHVDDWVLPLPDGALLGRGLPGDGHADLARLFRAVSAAGYEGPIEVEVLSEAVWAMPGDDELYPGSAVHLPALILWLPEDAS